MSTPENERIASLLHAADVVNEANLIAEQTPPGAGTEPVEEPALDQLTPLTVSILPLRGMLLYPMSAVPLRSALPRSIKLIDDAVLAKAPVGIIAARSAEKEEPGKDDIFDIGTMASIVRVFKAPDGMTQMIVQGGERFKVLEYLQTEPYLIARVEILPEIWEATSEIEALKRNIASVFGKVAELKPAIPDEFANMIQQIEDPRQLAYAVATYMPMEMRDAQKLLEMNGLQDKMVFLLQLLNKELEVLELGKRFQTEATKEMEKMQREFFLREQIKAIQKELGDAEDLGAEIAGLREKIVACNMNDEARKEAERELGRLSKLPPQAAEYGVIRTYLDWMTSLPWKQATADNLDIPHARGVLNADHYGLEDLKERILEFLAVRRRKAEQRAVAESAAAAELQASAAARASESEVGDHTVVQVPLADEPSMVRREREGVILCFVGPPGVGKTSLGASIARAMGRKFIRMSVGGVHDESEIRGFRRTYIGSMPGRIVQGLRRAESNNPVFMLDEIDKIGHDQRGDPSSALLEVLDPEQNREFRDHYLDVPFDLSQTIFVCTANTLDTIPSALRDRMEILALSGYTEREKLAISKGYLVPRQLKENGLKPGEIIFEDESILQLMRDYTREAGVRNLEREIGSICRKMVTRAAEDKVIFPITVKPAGLFDLLKKPRYYAEANERTSQPGVSIGLAWTPVGGDTMFIEATRMKGSKGFLLTGQLGDVMKESAQAALSYVRTHAEELHINPKRFAESDIHLHVPAGSTPKDGPSAGVTMATALVSLMTNRKVRSDLAMTGEITLRGSVLPVGGIKEKVLAAHRAGFKTIILPHRNEIDLDELPPEVRSDITFVLADRVQQVLDAALEPVKVARKRKPASKKAVARVRGRG